MIYRLFFFLRDRDDLSLCDVIHDVAHFTLVVFRLFQLLVNAALELLLLVLPRLCDFDLLTCMHFESHIIRLAWRLGAEISA